MRIVLSSPQVALVDSREGSGPGTAELDGRSLVELVLVLAQVQDLIETRRRATLGSEDLLPVEAVLIAELCRRGTLVTIRPTPLTRLGPGPQALPDKAISMTGLGSPAVWEETG